MWNGDQHGQEQSHDEHHLTRQGGDIHEQVELEVQSCKCADATISKDGGCKVDIPLRIPAAMARLKKNLGQWKLWLGSRVMMMMTSP